jgi:hypothetical protein
MAETEEKTKGMGEESEIETIEARKMKEDFLLELEIASNEIDKIGEHFEKMMDHVELDGSSESYFMLGFRTGFEQARQIESVFQSMVIINVSRKHDHQVQQI